MQYSLRRESDGEGDSGSMSAAVIWTDDSPYPELEHDARPRLGVAMRVGSICGRTFAMQDWWQTTPITEILTDEPNYVRFRTKNSIYEWRII